MRVLLVGFFVCIVACVHAKVGDTCKSQAECGSGECCQMLSEMMIASKRDVGILDLTATGQCKAYKKEGDYCSSFYRTCNCEPGLKCYTREEPVSSRMMMMVAPKPGYRWMSTCVKA